MKGNINHVFELNLHENKVRHQSFLEKEWEYFNPGNKIYASRIKVNTKAWN